MTGSPADSATDHPAGAPRSAEFGASRAHRSADAPAATHSSRGLRNRIVGVLVAIGIVATLWGVSQRGAAGPGAPVAAREPWGHHLTKLSPPVRRAPDRPEVPAGATRIADVRSADRNYSVYEWTEMAANPMLPAMSECAGSFTDTISYGMCEAPGSSETGIGGSWGSSDGAPSTMLVTDAPDAGAWLVLDTTDGIRAVGNIVAGTGLVEWPASSGAPSVARILDRNLVEVWRFDYSD